MVCVTEIFTLSHVDSTCLKGTPACDAQCGLFMESVRKHGVRAKGGMWNLEYLESGALEHVISGIYQRLEGVHW